MNKNICRSVLLSVVLVGSAISESLAQNYLKFTPSYSDCGLAINFKGKTESTKCKLIYTYDGVNLNLHFNSREGNVNFVTKVLGSGSVSVSGGKLSLSNRRYSLSHIGLSTFGGKTVSINGTGQCKKTPSEVTCLFTDTGGNTYAGVVYY